MRCLVALVCSVLVCSTGDAIACEERWPVSTPISTILPPKPLMLVHEDAVVLDEAGKVVELVPRSSLDLSRYPALRLVEVQKTAGTFRVRNGKVESYSISRRFVPSARVDTRRIDIDTNATYFRVEHCLEPMHVRANFQVPYVPGSLSVPDPERPVYFPEFERDQRVIAVFPDGSEQLVYDGPCAMVKDVDDPTRRWRLGGAIALLLLAGWLVHRQR